MPLPEGGTRLRACATLEVDQGGPYVDGKVNGHLLSFLVDTSATRSAVRTSEVQDMPPRDR